MEADGILMKIGEAYTSVDEARCEETRKSAFESYLQLLLAFGDGRRSPLKFKRLPELMVTFALLSRTP